MEPLQARRAWSNVLQALKDHTVNLDYSTQQNYLPDLKKKYILLMIHKHP